MLGLKWFPLAWGGGREGAGAVVCLPACNSEGSTGALPRASAGLQRLDANTGPL